MVQSFISFLIFTDVEPEELAGEEEEGLDLQESQEARKPPRGMLVTSYSQYYCTICRLDCSQHYSSLFYISQAVHTMADMCLGLCLTIACQIFRLCFCHATCFREYMHLVLQPAVI